MLSSDLLPPYLFYLMTKPGVDAGGDAIHSGIGDGVDRVATGSGIQQMNVNFDRAANWDEEREELTDRQRIRDLETYVFGDRRGFTVGVMRQMRNHLVWLIVLSGFQFLAILLQALLVWELLRGGG